jgi:4-hydroxy-tetrahydrodipicolinate reductase
VAGKTKIAISGAAGRMGRSLVALAVGDPELELVAALESAGCPALGQDAGMLAGIGRDCGVKIAAALAGKVDCIVDFSAPEGALARLAEAVKAGAALVCGTTGLDDKQKAAFAKAAAKIPVILSPNMSVGANLLFKLTGDAARALGAGYDIEVVEAHHHNKADAPSGTALGLAQAAADGRGLDLKKHAVHGRSGRPGARPRDEIGIHAVRAGDIIGEHTVIFATGGERIELVHRVGSRDGFCAGALRAAKFLAGKPPGSYTMAQVLGLG